ncbi:MAG: alpha-amylase family glycosyl hydrolase [Longimicrobiales bacterium]
MTRFRFALLLALALQPGALFAQLEPTATAADWWRSGVCYEVFVRSFQDSDGDGVGDFRGLIERLDYISDLGATCIWLMPIMPSPSYHGYDVTNYFDVNREYGTLEDFRALLDAAHDRGIHVLIDLVLNHTSSEHPYFRDALLDANSPYRDWFVWAPEQRPAPGWSAPVWHDVPTRDEYYYGLFWGGMPDYDLTEPEVQAEFERIARFWLDDVGVDGFRIDAVAHFFEGPGGAWRHGPGTHAWLREFAAALERIEPDAFTIGEVWDSIGAILPYYPDQLTAYFMFEMADAVFEAVRSGSAERLVSVVQRVQREVPDGRWGVFLRNHDQTRTLTDLGGDVARAKLAATLQLTLPGVPFVYYGEEIGMTGAKSAGDIRLRTPMHWTLEPRVGFTTGTPWEPLPADSFTANVAAQDDEATSLLNHYRRLIHARTSNRALATGDFVPLETGTPTVLAYLRRAGDRIALVVANLGETAVSDVRVALPAGLPRQGELAPRLLVSGGLGDSGDVRYAQDGTHAVVATLAPLGAWVIDLGDGLGDDHGV